MKKTNAREEGAHTRRRLPLFFAIIFITVIALSSCGVFFEKIEPPTYTVFFEKNNEECKIEFTYTAFSSIDEPQAPFRYGYTFSGWYKDAELSERWDFHSDILLSDTTLYAKWDESEYLITFIDSSEAPIRVKHGETIPKPEAPERYGYTFLGWYYDADYTKEFDFTLPQTDSKAVYAKWALNEYTVIFDTGINANADGEANGMRGDINGGAIGDTSGESGGTIGAADGRADTNEATWAVTVRHGERVFRPKDPQRVGYTFLGWYRDGVPFDFGEEITDDTVLTAAWAAMEYTVIYTDGDGDSEIFEDVIFRGIAYGTATPLPSFIPERVGYVFSGWDEVPSERVTESVIYNAVWRLDHEHDFTGKCTDDAYLKKSADCYCGAEYYYYCKHCFAKSDDFFIFGESNAHSFTEWKAVIEPRCETAGYSERFCLECGFTEGKAISPLGHSYLKSTVEPTCTDAGYTLCTCEREGCESSYVTDTRESLGHRYGEWEILREADYDEAGEMQRLCTVCGYAEHDVIPRLIGYEPMTIGKAAAQRDGKAVLVEGFITDIKNGSSNGETMMALCDGENCITLSGGGAFFGDVVKVRGVIKITDNGREIAIEEIETVGTRARMLAFVCGEEYISYETVLLGDVIDAPTAPEKEGYVFCGWYRNAELTETFIFPLTVTEDVTVYAKFEKKKCAHTGGFATCTARAICEICGEEYGEYEDHVWIFATCSAPMHCDTCGITVGVTSEHVLSEWETVTKPTCTAEGLQKRYCTNCSYEEEKTLKRSTHSYVQMLADERFLIKEADCENAATYCYSCVCGAKSKLTFTFGEKIGHDFGEWKSDGNENHIRYCQNDAAHYEIETCNFILTTVLPSCTDGGYVIHTCEVCGFEFKDGFIPAKGHTEAVDEAVEASCTESGLTEGVHCSACGKILVEQKVISAKGHSEVVDEAVGASCTEAGLTEGVHCSACGKILVGQKVISAKGHTAVLHLGAARDCETDGHLEYFECTNCGLYFTDEKCENLIGDVTALAEWLISDGMLVAHGHKGGNATCQGRAICEICHEPYGEIGAHKDTDPLDYECDVCGKNLCEDHEYEIKVIEASCTENGYTEATCKKCGKGEIYDYVSAKGHTEAVDEAVEASCTESGLTEGVHCSACGEILVGQKVISALGHVEVVDEAVEASCTEAGLTEGVHCSACGEILVGQKVISAKGHTEVVDEAVEASCTESGLTEGVHCSACGEILVEQKVIPAKGHTEIVDEAVEASCTESGLTAGVHCSACGEILVGQKVIPARGHAFSDEWFTLSSPTYTARGTEGRYCIGGCGEREIRETSALIANGAEEILREAYGLDDGEKLSCGYKYTLTGKIRKIITVYENGKKCVSVIIVADVQSEKDSILCYDIRGIETASLEIGDTLTVVGAIVNDGGNIKFDGGCMIWDHVPLPRVTFDSNGGGYVEIQSVDENGKVEEPETPTRDGEGGIDYEFGGWFSDEDLTVRFDFTSEIPESITLYAKWIITEKAAEESGSDEPVWGYKAVKDLAELSVGDRIIIVASGSSYALGKTQKSNNRSAAQVTKNPDGTLSFGDDVEIITLEAGTKNGTFALAVSGGYLYAASKSNNYLKTQSVNDGNGSWSISISDTGEASLVAQGTNTRNILRFNKSSTLFSCYKIGQMSIIIYKYQDLSEEKTYTVTFLESKNANDSYADVKVIAGNSAREPEPPQRDGYTFEGWYCGDDLWSFDSCVSSDITLYAKWSNAEKPTPNPDTGETEVKNTTIYLVGDSTVCAFNDNYLYPRYGWGTQLDKYLTDKATVKNLALSGRSSKSFIAEENYETLKNSIKEGDFLLIAFGHNDEKSDDPARFTDASLSLTNEKSFAYYLYNYYIKLAEEKGATPILVTPIVRANTKDDYNGASGHVTDNGDYREAILGLAEQKGVSVIDMTAITSTRYESLGYDEAIKYHAVLQGKYAEGSTTKIVENWETVDKTHLNIYGASYVAYRVANELLGIDSAKPYVKADISEPTADVRVANSGYTVPDYESPKFDSYTPSSNFTTITDGWYGTAFGNTGGDPTNASNGYVATETEAGVFKVGNEKNNKGKFDSTSDGFAFAFTQVEASKNFKITVNAKVISTASAKQAGFGLMLRDDCIIDQTANGSIASNYLTAGIYASSTTSMTANFYRENGTLNKGETMDDMYEAGDELTLTIERIGQTVNVKMIYGDKAYEESYYDFDLFARDTGYMYVGMFANRGTVVEFTNLDFTVTGESQGA